MSNFQEKSSFIWGIADSILRGNFRRSDYQNVILPFTVLKRFDSVLAYSKEEVVKAYEENHDDDGLELILMSESVDENGKRLGFYNYSSYDFKTLLEDPNNLESNLKHYLDCFSDNVKDIFIRFSMDKYIAKLSEKNILYKLMKKFSETKLDLSPKAISNHEMGTIFEELIRRFSEQSNEEAGEHFTPRDIVKLMTELLFAGEKNEPGSIKLVYDPACGTGGMLTSCKEYIANIDPNIDVVLYGQESEDAIYAMCKSDMLMKGEKAENIKGPYSTLSNDKLPTQTFDYMISNPPYGRDWETDEDEVKAEAELGFNGRFGAGLPRKSDGQFLFIQHMISKMKPNDKSKIAVITNGSPLFTGDAGSGESEIRKWILENDYLETLISLPTDLFFNTNIATYIWILTNKKSEHRKGKVQLINAKEKYIKMRRPLGKKRYILSDEIINSIVDEYISFNNGKNVKIFNNESFGYTKVTVERPMQLNYCVNNERIENLYTYAPFRNLSKSKNKDSKIKIIEEKKGKNKQKEIINALNNIGEKVYKNWDDFEKQVKNVLNDFNLKPVFIKNIIEKLSVHDNTAEYVTDKKGNYKPDSNLRETIKIPLSNNIESYFQEDILAHYPDAWYESKKNKIGYEINFAKYFHEYNKPRNLNEIEQDIAQSINEIQNNLLNKTITNEFDINVQLKNSGFSWIGEIPNSWNVLKSKYIFTRINKPSQTGTEELLSVSEYYGVKPKIETIDEGDFLSRSESLIGYKKCSQDNLVMNIMLAWKKGLGITKYNGIVSPAYEVFNTDNSVVFPRYMNYLLRTDLYASEFKKHSYGIIDSRLRLYPDNFKEIECILPPLTEQKSIAEYLDTEISKIDDTIDEIKKNIELLEEYKSSLIEHAVTGKINIRRK